MGGCLFPSLDGLSGGDASTADGNAPDAKPMTDAGSDGFTAGIGCGAATPDLLAYYTVDEGSGSVINDCVSPKNVGTINYPAHTQWVSGKHGGALEIDPYIGVCVSIDFATPTFTFGGMPTAAPFTVAMWINVVTLPGSTELGFIAGQASNIYLAGWRLSVAPLGTVQLAVATGTTADNVIGSKINPGTWHHIAAVFDGAASLIYVDGVAGTTSTMPAGFPVAASTDDMRIGCSSDNQHQLNAQIDEVRFYNRALTGAEIVIVQNAN
jgi:hypothetical protein